MSGITKGVQLVWDGKRAARTPTAAPLFRAETYGCADSRAMPNRLIHGDNLAVMTALREELAGRIALLYLDPPFFTGTEWHAQGNRRGGEGIHAYSDDWGGDLGAYLQWIYDRLTLARELLSEEGSLYMHLSWHVAHYVKLLLDEIFGVERFQNEIIWCYREAINSKKRWNRKHDTLLFYSKSERFTFNYEAVREAYSETSVKKYRLRDEKGAYRLMGRGIVGSPLRSRRDLPPEYEAQFPDLTFRHYLGQGTLPVDYWQIDIENQASHNRTGYPTQKPEALLERILLASSNPGDLVTDLCCGSGTTLAVAERLGRRWIGCDLGALAVHTTRKRLLEMSESVAFVVERTEADTPKTSEDDSPDVVQIEQTDGRIRFKLSPDAAELVDMWAVQWQTESQEAPFRPDWWAARTRRHPDLTALTPEAPLTAAPKTATIALTDAAGRTTHRNFRLARDEKTD